MAEIDSTLRHLISLHFWGNHFGLGYHCDILKKKKIRRYQIGVARKAACAPSLRSPRCQIAATWLPSRASCLPLFSFGRCCSPLAYRVCIPSSLPVASLCSPTFNSSFSSGHSAALLHPPLRCTPSASASFCSTGMICSNARFYFAFFFSPKKFHMNEVGDFTL